MMIFYGILTTILMVIWWWFNGWLLMVEITDIPSGKLIEFAIEAMASGFTHETWWFSSLWCKRVPEGSQVGLQNSHLNGKRNQSFNMISHYQIPWTSELNQWVYTMSLLPKNGLACALHADWEWWSLSHFEQPIDAKKMFRFPGNLRIEIPKMGIYDGHS